MASNLPAQDAFAITTSDSTTYAPSSIRGIYVGGAGDVKVDIGPGSQGVTFKAVPVGTILPICATKVYATGTTATLMVALS